MNLATTPRDFSLSLIKKEKSSKDAYSFYFDRKNVNFDFHPGQYIRMTLQMENPDERGKSRFFSIASSPLRKDHIMITTRIIQSTFKKTLYDLTPGSQVQFFGPTGRFIFYDEEKDSHVFLAGGIGITPFYSMITYAASKKLTIPITLFASFATVEDVIFQKELEEISRKNPNIKVVYTITQPQPKADRPLAEKHEWNGETGRISEDLIKKHVSNPPGSIYYIAGPPKMVEAMAVLVQGMRIVQEKIRKENFVGY